MHARGDGRFLALQGKLRLKPSKISEAIKKTPQNNNNGELPNRHKTPRYIRIMDWVKINWLSSTPNAPKVPIYGMKCPPVPTVKRRAGQSRLLRIARARQRAVRGLSVCMFYCKETFTWRQCSWSWQLSQPGTGIGSGSLFSILPMLGPWTLPTERCAQEDKQPEL